MFAKILVVEDDQMLSETLGMLFKRQGWSTTRVETVTAAFKHLERTTYDLAVVDRSLPDGDGLQVIEYADVTCYSMRTLILSGLADSVARVHGLEAGADDYLTKPFSSRELLLRVAKLLLTDKRTETDTISYRDLVLTPMTGELIMKDNCRHLRPKEALILECFIRHQRQIVTRPMLINYVWRNTERAPDITSLDVYVRRVRMAIKLSDVDLKTKRHVGYYLE